LASFVKKPLALAEAFEKIGCFCLAKHRLQTPNHGDACRTRPSTHQPGLPKTQMIAEVALKSFQAQDLGKSDLKMS